MTSFLLPLAFLSFRFCPMSAVEEASVAKTYALHTILPPSASAKYVDLPETAALKGVIATVVCIIQGGGGRIDEGGTGGSSLLDSYPENNPMRNPMSLQMYSPIHLYLKVQCSAHGVGVRVSDLVRSISGRQFKRVVVSVS